MPTKRFLTVFSILTILLTIVFTSCSNRGTSKSKEGDKENLATAAGPPVIIYKTKMDYSSNVPVILSDDKSRITSYPGIKDIMYKGNFAYPTELTDGFLLDNRGINENVAFLDYTYEEYSKLDKTPASDELMGHIMEYDPLVEMYNCGTRYDYKNMVDELNTIIAEGSYKGCEKLK